MKKLLNAVLIVYLSLCVVNLTALHTKSKRKRKLAAGQLTLDAFLKGEKRARVPANIEEEDANDQLVLDIDDADIDLRLVQMRQSLMQELNNHDLRIEFVDQFNKRIDLDEEDQELKDLLNTCEDRDLVLMWAARNNEAQLCRRLIALGASVSASLRGRTALWEAVKHTALAAVQALLADKSSVDTHCGSMTPLLLAAKNNSTQIVALLASHSQSIDSRTHSGKFTALMYAARNGNLTMVQDLLAQNASVDLVSKKGHTALMFACQSGSVATCQALLDAGANVNAQAPDGTSSLFSAVLGNKLDVVNLLLERGADLYQRLSTQDTVLHCAARQGDKGLVRLLVIHAFKVRIRHVYAFLGTCMRPSRVHGDSVAETVPHLLYRGREQLLKKHVQKLLADQAAAIKELLEMRDTSQKRAYDYLHMRYLRPDSVAQIDQELWNLEQPPLEYVQTLAGHLRDGSLLNFFKQV